MDIDDSPEKINISDSLEGDRTLFQGLGITESELGGDTAKSDETIHQEKPKPRIASDGVKPHFNHPENYLPGNEPKSMPGVEFTMVGPYEEYFGLIEPRGFPGSLITMEDLTPVDKNKPSYMNLVYACRNEQVNPLERDQVQSELIRHNFWGHSFTGSADDMAAALYDVIRFGLWPEKNTKGQYEDGPWVGDFRRSHMGVSAGDFFRGYAVAYDPKQVIPVEIPDKKTYFISPVDLLFIVPSQTIKDSLIEAIRKDSFMNPSKKLFPPDFLQTHIKTFKEIIDKSVTQ